MSATEETLRSLVLRLGSRAQLLVACVIAIIGLFVAQPAQAGYYSFSQVASGQQSVTYGDSTTSTTSTSSDYWGATADSGGSSYALPTRTASGSLSGQLVVAWSWVTDDVLTDPAPSTPTEVGIDMTATAERTSVDAYGEGSVSGSVSVSCTGDSESASVSAYAYWDDDWYYYAVDGEEDGTGTIPLFYRTTISGSSGSFTVNYAASVSMSASTTISAGLSVTYQIGVPLVLLTAPSGVAYSPPNGYTYAWGSPAIAGGGASQTSGKWTFTAGSLIDVNLSIGFPDSGYSWRAYITAVHADSGTSYGYNDQVGNGGSSTPSTVSTTRLLPGTRWWAFKSSLKMFPPGSYPGMIVKSLKPFRAYAK